MSTRIQVHCQNKPHSGCDHPDWEHATSYEEIEKAAKTGKAHNIFGYKVLRVEYDATRAPSAGQIVAHMDNRDSPTIHIEDSPDFIGHILINTEPDPPTEEELAETLASIQKAIKHD